MIVTNHVDLHHIEESIVFQQIKEKSQEILMNVGAEVMRLDQK